MYISVVRQIQFFHKIKFMRIKDMLEQLYLSKDSFLCLKRNCKEKLIRTYRKMRYYQYYYRKKCVLNKMRNKQ